MAECLEYMISSGAKNAMYTLWTRCGEYYHYVTNLSIDADKAEEKVRAYMASNKDHYPHVDHVFIGFYAGDLFQRGKGLSVRDTENLTQIIEFDLFPFGKHAGTKISDAPDSYIMYFADKLKDADKNQVSVALCNRCMGIALERGLIAKRDVRRQEIADQNAKSNFIGTVGERRNFTGKIVMVRDLPDNGYGISFVTKMLVGDDIVTYIGGKILGDVNETVTVKATIKAHEVYNDVKSTRISRPAEVHVK